MKNLKSTLLFLVLIATANANSQESFKHDIGLTVTSYENQRVGLDYRLSLNDHWKFRAGAFGGSHYSNFFSSGEISEVTDSLITFRKYMGGSNDATLKLGAERRFGASLFSIHADVLIGYRNSTYGYSNDYSELDSSGVWITQYGFPNFDIDQPLGDSTRSQITKHYLVPGFQLGANINIPIKNRFELTVSATGVMSSPIFLKSTNVTDPYGEFSNAKFTYFDFNTSISATLRYRFGLKE